MLTPYPWQQQSWRRLTGAAEQDRLAHALLLTGEEGAGVDEFARALAAALLCEGAATGGACGECRSCRLFLAGNHPDFTVIAPEEPGKAIKVEAVRELIDGIHLSSQYGRYKIAVIEPAEAMNRNAANSLLKTLEEPPPEAVLILNSRRPAMLPVTIRSRCQHVDLPATAGGAALDWLAEQLDGDRQRAGELMAMSRNRPLAALRLEEDGILEQQAAVLADLETMSTRPADPVATARGWLEHDAARVMQWLLVFIRIMTRQQLTPAAGGASSRLHQRLGRLAAGMDLQQLLKWYDIVLDNYRAATGPFNLNQQGLLEDVIVHWQALVQDDRRIRQ